VGVAVGFKAEEGDAIVYLLVTLQRQSRLRVASLSKVADPFRSDPGQQMSRE
jgi:hypothetical protein